MPTLPANQRNAEIRQVLDKARRTRNIEETKQALEKRLKQLLDRVEELQTPQAKQDSQLVYLLGKNTRVTINDEECAHLVELLEQYRHEAENHDEIVVIPGKRGRAMNSRKTRTRAHPDNMLTTINISISQILRHARRRENLNPQDTIPENTVNQIAQRNALYRQDGIIPDQIHDKLTRGKLLSLEDLELLL